MKNAEVPAEPANACGVALTPTQVEKMSQKSLSPLTLCSAILLSLQALSVTCQAEAAAPFSSLAGQWSGNGTINLSDNRREPVRCRASYDVPSNSNLQLNIRCASDSYNFDLRGSANYASGAITGSWSEASRNISGTLKGTAGGERIQVIADGPAFSASLTLTTRGDRQSVVIQSQKPDSTVTSASINLRR
jgi:hypothetical protein